MRLVILTLGTGLQRLWLRHCTRLTMCLLLLVAFLPPWRTKGKLLWISYDFRMSMHKTNFNEQRFYELIPVVTRAAWEDLLRVLCYKGIEGKGENFGFSEQ